MFVIFFLLLLKFSCIFGQDKPYNFQPESRHIEINENDDFVVSFQQLGNNETIFGHCHIQGGTFSADWTIFPPKIDENIQVFNDFYKGFSPYNNTGVCGFVFYTVDNTVPREWTLTAFDNKTNQTFTETVKVTFYYNIPQYIDRVEVLPTSSVVNVLQPSTSVKISKCLLSIDSNTLELDLFSIKVYNQTGFIFKSRLSSLGDGKCGYRINNLAVGESRTLLLYATDQSNKTYRTTTDIILTHNHNLVNRIIEATVGESAIVYCGSRNGYDADQSQRYCLLYHPNGDLVTNNKNCRYDLDIVTLEDLGNWTCTIGFDYIMDSLQLRTELVEKKRQTVVTFTEEDSNNYLVLGCKFNNYQLSRLDYCTFTRPDGKVFSLYKGSATDKYSTFTSDLTNFRCSLEIMKPLRDVDKGDWKCEAVDSGQTLAGGFITVEQSKNFPYDKYIKKNVQLGHSFVINCMAPYSSDNCYVMAPNGTQYKSDVEYQSQAGVCTLTVEKATPTDNGTWSCSMAQKNGIPNDIIRVDISIIDLKILYADVEANSGDLVQLICNTNGIPLNYCRFVSPSGVTYSLRKDNAMNFNKINYNGQGLEYGDCGIAISDITHADSGQWQCHISSGTTTLSKSVELVVNSPVNIRTAESVGIAAGTLAAALIVGGYVFYRFTTKRTSREVIPDTVEFSGRESNGSGSSGEAVVLALSHGTNYNTQNVILD